MSIKLIIFILVIVAILTMAIVGHEKDPEKKANLQERHPPKKR